MAALLVGPLLVALSSLALADGGDKPSRPNILLLMAEDLSPRIGAFGDPVADTPNLDRLAREGVTYTRTFTTAGVCAPSRAAHILGVHQISTGTQHMRTSGGPLGSYRSVPPPQIKAYPELMRAAGYYTYTDSKLDYQFSGTMSNSGPFTIWDDEGSDTHWRNRGGDQPFFGFLNFQVTHESGIFPPLGDWPHSFTHLLLQVVRAVRAPDVVPPEPTDPDRVPVPPYFPDTPTVRQDLARHYDNIAVMDRQVGRILAALEADGLAESTIVVWTSDHGDGLPRGKRELFDSGLHVPMIIRWPAAYRPPGVSPGAIDARLISFVDLAPTLLRLARVEVPDDMHGRDFVRGEPRRYVYAARDRIDEVPDRQRAVRDERYKYIRSWHPGLAGGHALAFRDNLDMVRQMRRLYEAGELNAAQRQWFEAVGEERLFDTRADPHELDNLSEDPAHQDELDRLRRELAQWLERVGDWSQRDEADMVADFQPGGERPETPPPQLRIVRGHVVVSAQEGASIGYRVDGGDWELYSEPLPLPAGAKLSAKAVRYGWEESDTVAIRLPPQENN